MRKTMTRSQLIEACNALRQPGDALLPHSLPELRRRLTELSIRAHPPTPKLSFADACARYVHRFTIEHVPSWAATPAPEGKYYAPQFATDQDWYDATVFPPHTDTPDLADCHTTNQTWPLGKWLDKPFIGGH